MNRKNLYNKYKNNNNNNNKTRKNKERVRIEITQISKTKMLVAMKKITFKKKESKESLNRIKNKRNKMIKTNFLIKQANFRVKIKLLKDKKAVRDKKMRITVYQEKIFRMKIIKMDKLMQ